MNRKEIKKVLNEMVNEFMIESIEYDKEIKGMNKEGLRKDFIKYWIFAYLDEIFGEFAKDYTDADKLKIIVQIATAKNK